jgi:hypothetical protein
MRPFLLVLALLVASAAAAQPCESDGSPLSEVFDAVEEAAATDALVSAELESGNPALRTRASILVGGINDTWHVLDPWAPRDAKKGWHVLGFPYDQRRKTNAQNAAILARELRSLQATGVTRVRITAHSMGGLIVKAALDEMQADGSLARFERVDFTALGTPWGGFDSANSAHSMRNFPGAKAIMKLVGKPMSFEMGSKSPFIKDRDAPLPPNVRFTMKIGLADDIATPRSDRERANFEAVRRLATSVVEVDGAGHMDVARP